MSKEKMYCGKQLHVITSAVKMLVENVHNTYTHILIKFTFQVANKSEKSGVGCVLWLTPVILATQKVKIMGIWFEVSLSKKLAQTRLHVNQYRGVVGCLSSNPS
jgi:hypothetical protein